jgi:histidinol-phosphate/aromatic aminotransferase/cobyric acid decarboxylase-like protein
VTGNGAGFTDAACVSYYRTIRAQVPGTARQIGYGVNKMPPAVMIRRWLIVLYGQLFRGRVTDYATADDLRERELVADLAGQYLGIAELDPDSVLFCGGTTEAISIVLGFARTQGMGVVLPLPLYCSFEQSAARHGVPVAAHYGAAGQLAWSARHAGPLLTVDIAPNGVTGSWFSPPEMADLRVVDHVFALPTYQPRAEFRAELWSRIGDLAQTAVFLTPSKDLSVPGLRCGTIITGHPGLKAYIRADRFERGYATHAGAARVAAAHLALLLLAFADEAGQPATRDWLRAAFDQAGLAFPADRDCQGFLAHLARMRRRAAANIRLIDGTGYLVQVGGRHVAGYSAFRDVRGAPAEPATFTGWIRTAGQAGLKLNPNCLFGGNPARWQDLYPGCRGIRVNVSVPPSQLAADLALLGSLLPDRGPDEPHPC